MKVNVLSNAVKAKGETLVFLFNKTKKMNLLKMEKSEKTQIGN